MEGGREAVSRKEAGREAGRAGKFHRILNWFHLRTGEKNLVEWLHLHTVLLTASRSVLRAQAGYKFRQNGQKGREWQPTY